MSRKEELLKKYNELNSKILDLRSEMFTVKKELNEMRFGVKIGEDITYEGKKGKVKMFSGNWVIINLYKKNGTLRRHQKICFDLEPKFRID